ncbi:hypothetical protein [Mesotoga sp.]|uniref:Ig-like domain-containing protein n=1 Tax=Mesotoga sp. TaxID=2053577 RepID=UPI00345EE7B9
MKKWFISILLFVLLTASMLLITGCPRVQNKVPTVIKVSGPSGTITQSSTTFSWTGSDSDGTIDRYEYRKDFGNWVSNGTNTSYVWDDYSEGSHTFEVRAKDNQGEYSEPASWGFSFVQNSAPILEITDQTMNEGETLTINLLDYTTDSDALDTFTYTILSGVGNIVGSTYTYSATYTDSGIKTVNIRVTDNKGGTDECEFSITVNNVNTEWIIEITGTDSGSSFIQIDYSIIPESLPSHVVIVMRSSDNISFSNLCTLSYEETQLIDTNVLSDKTYFYELKLLSDDDVLDNAKTNVKTSEEAEVTYETSDLYGNVELPEEIDPTTLVVRNMEKVASLDDEGNFEIDVKTDQVSLLFCSVPDYEIPLMTVVSPGVSGMELQSAQEINELTTAKSLLMLNPFLATPFPDSMAKVNEAIDACSYLQTLEHLIERLNNGESEVEDELVDTIGSALDEIIEYLNEHYPMEENSTIYYPTQVVLPLLDGESSHMDIINIDQETTSITCPIIEREGKQYYKVVPKIPNIRFSLNSVVMLTKMNDSLSNDMMLEFQHTSPIGPYIEALPQFGAVKSDCFTEWIDFLGKIIDEAIDILFEVMLGDTETPLLIIPAYEEGNYAFTAYGGFADSTENEIFLDDLWSFILKVTSGEGIDVTNLPYELLSFITMIRLNLMDIALNVVSMVADISELSGEELSSGIVNATMKGLEHGFKVANFASKSELQNIGKWAVFAREYAVNANVELVKVVTEIAVKAGAGKAAGAVLKIIGKEALKWLTVVPKVLSIASNGGEIVARVTSMLAIATPRELTFISVCKQNETPTVTKASGPNGEISESSSTFTWTGSDPDGTITKYEYRKDGGTWTSNGTSKSYTWSDYSKGDHKFEVRAQDNKGAYSEIICWDFNYQEENTPPTVTKVSGPDGEVSESSSTFTWTGSDSDGTITKYEYRKDGGSWVSNGTSTSYTWSDYSKGDHKFEVRAQDDDGKYSNVVTWNFTYSHLPFPYALTTNLYWETEDLEQAVKNEFGPNATIGDWAELKSEYSGRIMEFIDALGITIGQGNSILIQNDGDRFYFYGSRHYFITRFDGDVPYWYLVHDQIDDYTLVLGSWYDVQYKVLVKLN